MRLQSNLSFIPLPTNHNGKPSRIPALFLLCLFGCAESGRASEPVTNSVELHALDRETALRNLEAHVTGVVTYAKGVHNPEVIIQDALGGIYLQPPAGAPEVHPGQRLEVDGVTTFWDTAAPSISARTIRVLGTEPLPEPKPVSITELAAADEDRYVEISGVIRSAREDRTLTPSRLLIDLADLSGKQLELWVLHYDSAKAKNWIDAEVKARGVIVHFHNHRAQPVAMRMLVNSLDDITITRPAPADAFAGLESTIDGLMQFPGVGTFAHRELVSGTVTSVAPGDVFHLQRNGKGLRVRTRQNTPLQPGDEVKVSGFPTMGVCAAELEDASYQVVSQGNAVEPIEFVEGPTPFCRENDARLVSVRGKVADVFHAGERDIFIIDRHGVFVRAIRRVSPGDTRLHNVRLGSQVLAVGVCEALPNPEGRKFGIGPDHFDLLLRTPADLTILTPGPWWTIRRFAFALAAALSALALALWWAIAANRQKQRLTREIERRRQTEAELEQTNAGLEERVNERSAALVAQIAARQNAEVRFAAISAERNRLARELHDTMEQMLTGANVQLALAKQSLPADRPESTRCLDLARRILTQARVEARRSVFDLQPQLLTEHNLVEALHEVMRQLVEGTKIHVEIKKTGTDTLLPPIVDRQLLRIVQEAVTNAVKHAGCTQILIDLNIAADEALLRIRDNGSGFAPSEVPTAADGHFGLEGMRERACRLQGKLQIETAAGSGTTIEARVPLTPHLAETFAE